MWKWLEQYFTFTRGERNGIVALVIVVLAVIIIPRAYFYFRPVQHTTNPAYEKEIESFANNYKSKTHTGSKPTDSVTLSRTEEVRAPDSPQTVSKHNYRAVHYFDFDPNKIGVNEWVQLGFSERQAESIEKYKAKGGKFYRPDDLKRLYVMTDEHFEKLLPYVKIDVNALPPKKYRTMSRNGEN